MKYRHTLCILGKYGKYYSHATECGATGGGGCHDL